MAVDLEDRPDQKSSAPGNVGGYGQNTPQGIYDNEFDNIANRLKDEGVGHKAPRDDQDAASTEPSDLSAAESSPKDVNYSGDGAKRENKALAAKTGEPPTEPQRIDCQHQLARP